MSKGGIGFSGALGLLFIGLKLGGAIDWSWWWVLSPFWIGWVVALVILVVVAWPSSPSRSITRRSGGFRVRD